jgi:hypothetical protein
VTLYVWHTQAVSVHSVICLTYTGCQCTFCYMFDIHRLSVYILLYNKLVTLYVWHTQAVSVHSVICLTYTVTLYVWHTQAVSVHSVICLTYTGCQCTFCYMINWWHCMFDIHRLSVYILLYNKLVTLYVWHTQAVSVHSVI